MESPLTDNGNASRQGCLYPLLTFFSLPPLHSSYLAHVTPGKGRRRRGEKGTTLAFAFSSKLPCALWAAGKKGRKKGERGGKEIESAKAILDQWGLGLVASLPPSLPLLPSIGGGSTASWLAAAVHIAASATVLGRSVGANLLERRSKNLHSLAWSCNLQLPQQHS